MLLTRYSIYYIFLLIVTFSKTLAVGTKCPKPELISPCRCLMKREERQVWCSHSDLPSILSGLRSLSKSLIAPIDELILENNYLPSLPGRTFASLKVLRIMLRQNGLERISPDWLHELEDSLMELFIVEPKLRYLPDDSLSRMNALEAITIQTNDLKRLPQISSLLKLRYLQVESVALNELSPRNFKNLPILEKFHISGSKELKRLDAGLFVDLPHLKSINVSHCGIFWIHPRTFSNLPKLRILSLVGNDVREAGMVGRACKDIRSLEELILDNNKIDKLTRGSFVDLPSLRTLHLSHNKIIEIHRGAFHRLPKFKILHLNNNMLIRIHPESFIDGGPDELWMTHNQISKVSELRSILNTLPRLTYLDLSFNELERIPYGSLTGHPTLEVMKLNCNKICQIDKESFMAMPALRELSLKNNSLTNSNQESLWNLPSLKGLDLSQNKFKKVESFFLANLPSLRRLDISDNQLTVIDPIAFSPTPLIEFVNISKNNLQFIHPVTFKHQNKLYELDASRNYLEEFLIELPQGLEYLRLHHNKLRILPLLSGTRKVYSLKYMDISYNLIEKINSFIFKKIPLLRSLYLNYNVIKHLEEKSLVGLTNLEKLDLSFNRIVGIHPSSLENTHNLIELNLRNNLIENIPTDLIQKVPKLTKLDVSENKLVDFIQSNLKSHPSIEYLNISHNYLVEMPKNILKMKHMTILDLSHNRIKNLSVESFSKLESLVDLRISYNFIRELRLSTFSKMFNLRILYLDHNDIDKIETNTFKSLPILEMIKLDHNKLSTISSYTFNNLTMLQVAELQSNNLQFVASDAFNLVPNLIFLNISQNNIKNIEESGLRNIPSLEVLDLSKNLLERIDSDSFKQMEWLVEIKLDQNKICDILGTPFSDMPRLRIISLRRNRMKRVSEKVLERIRTNIAHFDVDENPLICDCNILWLQIWAEETSVMGPHCSNGNLVREIKLSPLHCKQKPMKEAYTDCEESTNNFYHTFTKFPNLRSNISSEEKNNNLAPLPQESEYFYDEYVDYPFNESVSIVSKDDEGILDRFLKVNHSSLMMPQESSHFIPGDTPTLYAALSKNKSKPDIPKEVPHSPSNSGFTFFGVPLPSINFNQFLGGNNKKGTAKSTEKSHAPVADRKVAIVNFPVSRATTSRTLYRQPPSTPFIETGGFRPMLPGEGGFIPMVETTTILSDFSTTESFGSTENTFPISEISERNQEASEDSSDLASSPVIRTTSLFDLETSTPKTDSFTTDRSPIDSIPPTLAMKDVNHVSEKIEELNPTELSIRNKFNTTNNNDIKNITITQQSTLINTTQLSGSSEVVPVTIKVETTTRRKDEKTEITTIETRTRGEDKKIETVDLVPGDASLIKAPDIIATKDSARFKKMDPPVNNIPKPNITNSSSSDVTTHIPVEKNQNISDKIVFTTKNSTISRIVNETRKPELTLLIPGGQQPPMRTIARSTITKVLSPFTTEAITSMKLSDERNAKKMGETVTLDPEITKFDENKESWYFANYNKTYSEPFHGIKPNCVGGLAYSEHLLILLLSSVHFNAFVHLMF